MIENWPTAPGLLFIRTFRVILDGPMNAKYSVAFVRLACILLAGGNAGRVGADEPIVASQPSAGTPTEGGDRVEALTPAVRLEVHLGWRQLILYNGAVAVKTYPIAVGRAGWETPMGDFRVLQMVKDPSWKHPLTGRIFVPGQRGNQLGHYWIGFWSDGKVAVGFHGTPHPQTIGKPVSHGCIRMYAKDIEDLFQRVNLGAIVNVLP